MAVSAQGNQIVKGVLLHLGVVLDVVNLDLRFPTVGDGTPITAFNQYVPLHLSRDRRTIWHDSDSTDPLWQMGFDGGGPWKG
jgi:hypothetical protein